MIPPALIHILDNSENGLAFCDTSDITVVNADDITDVNAADITIVVAAREHVCPEEEADQLEDTAPASTAANF